MMFLHAVTGDVLLLQLSQIWFLMLHVGQSFIFSCLCLTRFSLVTAADKIRKKHSNKPDKHSYDKTLCSAKKMFLLFTPEALLRKIRFRLGCFNQRIITLLKCFNQRARG